MFVLDDYVHRTTFPNYPWQWNRSPIWVQPDPRQQQQQGVSLGEILMGAVVIGAAIWGAAALLNPDTVPQRTCGVCGRARHDRRTCPYDGERISFSGSIPKSRRCECCGSSRYGTQRHHPQGRASVADFLDVCLDCHVECCHGGHFQNLGGKPRTCRMTGNRSLYRN